MLCLLSPLRCKVYLAKGAFLSFTWSSDSHFSFAPIQFESGLLDIVSKVKLGSPLEFDTFMSAVIDGASFKRIKNCLDFAKNDSSHKIIFGGNATFEKGFFVEPTIIVTTDPYSKLLTNEIFGPVLTVFVYDDNKIDHTMELIDKSTPYGLTGAIFATDKYAPPSVLS